MFVSKKIIGFCLFLAALIVPAAHAETVFVNPGPVGGQANDFSFGNSAPAAFIDIVWTDNKTLEWDSGTHLFFVYGSSCAFYTGFLLDAAGNAIPDTELAGRALCPAGSDLSASVIDLPAATVFSGIRLISAAFATSAGYQWNWKSDDRPVIGQTDASGDLPPVPDAGGPYEGVAGQPVTFDASDSSDPDGTIVTYNWDFGDDTSLGGQTIPHTYASAGKYNVTLTVTDDAGLIQSTSTIADIGNNSLRPTADAGGPYTGEAGVQVQFDGTGSTDPDDGINQYDWNFGDGSPVLSGTATPGHFYAEAGTYYVVLTVTDNTGNIDSTVAVATITDGRQAPEANAGPPAEGVVGTAVSFDGGGSSDDVGIASYDWDFGDNNTGTGVNPSHTYAAAGDYTVVLTVTDGDGFQDSATTAASIDANPLPPRADAGPPAEGTAGVAVSFDGSGSADSDGNIVTYAWDFGDGSAVDTVSGANPSHTYAAAGNYTVRLTVTDNDGLSSTEDTTQAAISQPNSPPTADAGGPYAGIVNQPVILVGADSSDGDGDIVQYAWDFDDGNTGSGLYVSHTYTASGVYEVTLTVTDDSGDTDETNAVVVVGGGAIQPPMVFTTGPYNGVAGVPLTVDGSNSSDPDGIINTFDWAFGDGNSANGPMPVNTYVASGLYAVTLQVTDDDGFTSSGGTIARIGNLSVPPNAVASVNNQQYRARVGVPVAFNGGDSSDADGTINRYDWAFGDGLIALDAGATPSNTYATPGWYLARLTVTDDSGEIDTDVAVVEVGIGNLPPLAHAGAVVSGKKGKTITFDGSASTDSDGNVARYDWSFGDNTVLNDAGATPSHTYAAAGKYFVVMTVTDNDGQVSSDVTVADIQASGGGGGSSGSDFLGCSISSREVKDPTLLLLVLFAVLYLARKRAGCVRM